MASSQFAHCHPDFVTGLMWCMHHNGSWIALPLLGGKQQGENEKSSIEEEEISEED